MHFYVVHSKEGVSVVRKVTPVAEFPYVDVRNFTMADWQKRPQLSIALTKAKKVGVLGEAATNSVGNSVGNTVSNTIDNWANDQNWNR